jgi:hypothetical protein
MTDEEMEQLNLFTVPWHWTDVKTSEYETAAVNWCIEMGLDYEIDYYVETIDETVKVAPRGKITKVVRTHHWLFKDPQYATMFRLKFSEQS